ncbi:CDC6 [Candida oxycetoniae]|uniref:Cell division control protein n=1 Tax=Candida oxycetoniae TaxID=497107 RepID=A0AAI9SU58_9ASCO|nr:CDC6 [Candida oxycetoniae]KAI3402940.2 CDC6 [Candida oxycetoniae]
MSTLTPASTPQKKKRTIRDISNTYKDNVQLPLTPTKTPQSKRLKLEHSSPSDVSCRKKLIFNTPCPTPPQTRKSSIYSQAKNLFQRGYACELSAMDNKSQLISRETEAQHINEFIQSSVDLKQSNSLYISGPPGTGKTAQVNLSLKRFQQDFLSVKVVNINCMTLRNPESIFHEIYCSIVDKLSISFLKKKNYNDLYQLLNKQDCDCQHLTHIILVLDELDALLTKSQQVIFKLFQLANKSARIEPTHIKVILLGISNTLDMNNKFLPKLFQHDLIPRSLQFLPYSAVQIKSIINSRLKTLPQEVIQPTALQFCCQKAASLSGDLRKAFDICYKSIELVEREQTRVHDKDGAFAKVTVAHIAKTCVESFKSDNTAVKDLNLLQKAILCQLFNCQVSMSLSCYEQITVNMFYDYYQKQTDMNRILGNLKYGEFIEILTALESSNCIILSDTSNKGSRGGKKLKNDGGMKSIKLNVEYDDIAKGIEDIQLLKRVLRKSTTSATLPTLSSESR